MESEMNINKFEQLIAEGRAEQRRGIYTLAVRKYVEALKLAPEDEAAPRSQAFHLLGQAFYLLGDYSYAAASQQVSFSYMLVPKLLENYKKLLAGQLEDSKRDNIIQFLSLPAIHLGHAKLDPQEIDRTEFNKKSIELYKYITEGHERTENSDFAGFNSNDYEMRCIDAGFREVGLFFDAATKNYDGFKKECAELGRSIIAMPFKHTFK